MVLLWAWLGRRLPSLALGEIARSAARTGIASIAGAGAGYATVRALGAAGRLLPGLLGGAAFAVVFLLVAWMLRSPELESLMAPIRRRSEEVETT